MNLLALAAATTLRLLDPTGDAAGDGTLLPPTSPAYANVSVFDLQEVALVPGASEDEPVTLAVSMGSVELTDALPAGFNKVVVDVYIDTAPGGAEVTLDGPGLLMPLDRGWDYAVRISPRGAFGAVAPLEAEAEVQWQQLPLALDGDTFVVSLPWALGEQRDLYAVTGLFDAFSPSGWRELSRTPSAWSFYSETQALPVVDVLAVDQEAQVRVLTTGVLPAPATPRDASGLPWLVTAVGGVLIALYGMLLRRRVPAPQAAAVDAGEAAADADADEAATDKGVDERVADADADADEGVAEDVSEEVAEEVTEAGGDEAPGDAGEAGEHVGSEEPLEDAEAVGSIEASDAEVDGSPDAVPDEDEAPAQHAAHAPDATPRRRLDPLAVAWTEDEDEEDDDLTSFLPRSPRAKRDLLVEDADEEEGA